MTGTAREAPAGARAAVGARMSRQAYLLYPLPFAVSVVLSQAANNPGQYRVSDMLTVAVVVLLAVAAVLGLTMLALRAWERSDRSEHLAAALTMLGVAWVFFYLPFRSAMGELSGRLTREPIPLSLALLASLAAVAWLLRTRRELSGLGRFMLLFGALLAAMPTLRIVRDQVRAARTIAASGLAADIARPVRTTGPLAAGRNDPKRDIYLIVLDTRVSSTVLREEFGVDDSAFDDSLRALGFVVPRAMHSNYAQTMLSLPSLLNFQHVTRLADDAGRESRDYSLPRHLIAHNRATRFLQQRGYEFLFFPSAWFSLTERIPTADEEFNARPTFNVRDELRRTELRRSLVRSTLLRYVGGVQRNRDTDPAHYFRTFAALKEVPADPDPTFAFAHFLLPHRPYLVDASCRLLDEPIIATEEADTPAQRDAYVHQLQCVDKLVLDLVTGLLARSTTPPIILVVGDHGTMFNDLRYWRHPESVPIEFARERFGVLGAFHLPAGGDSLFTEPVTLVNVMRNVFRYYFNAELPPLANDQYVSGTRLYKFYRLDTLRILARR